MNPDRLITICECSTPVEILRREAGFSDWIECPLL